MKIRHNPTATKAFADAPPLIQKAFLKQAGFLIQNLHHPSLHAKKYVNQNVYTQSGVEVRRVAVDRLERSLQIM